MEKELMNNQTPIVEQSGQSFHPIRPGYIDLKSGFWGRFGDMQTEASAAWVMQLLQDKGYWTRFTLADIEKLHGAKFPNSRFQWNNLISQGYILEGPSGTFAVTHEFICVCYASSPHDYTLFT